MEQIKNKFANADNWRFPGVSAIRLAMLTVLIETENDEEGLARTLASLVGAAVEGVVCDVIVVDRGSTDQTHRVAEHAGCGYVSDGGLTEALRQAKGDWLLFLEPGASLAEGWCEAVVGHVSVATMPARFSRIRADRRSLLSRIFASQTALSEGLIIRKSQAASLSSNAGSGEALARGLPATRLAAEIRVAQKRERAIR